MANVQVDVPLLIFLQDLKERVICVVLDWCCDLFLGEVSRGVDVDNLQARLSGKEVSELRCVSTIRLAIASDQIDLKISKLRSKKVASEDYFVEVVTIDAVHGVNKLRNELVLVSLVNHPI